MNSGPTGDQTFLLITAGKTTDCDLAVRNSDIQCFNGGVANGTVSLFIQHTKFAITFYGGHHNIVVDGHFQKQTLLFAVFGQKTNAGGNGIARVVDLQRITVQPDAARQLFLRTKNHLGQFRTARTHKAG